MSALQLRLLAASDADALYAFEQDNRAYFEQWINARAADFYSASGFVAELARCLELQGRDQAYHYLVKDGAAVVGRVNLTGLRRAHYHSASLGYRVGEPSTGRGIAKHAVGAVLRLAFGQHGLQRVEATSRPENAASVRILQANGFAQFGHSRRSFQLGADWFDLLHFEVHAPAATAQATSQAAAQTTTAQPG